MVFYSCRHVTCNSEKNTKHVSIKEASADGMRNRANGRTKKRLNTLREQPVSILWLAFRPSLPEQNRLGKLSRTRILRVCHS